ncbi:hypothetical protein [Cryptosporangium arvum]|uniref:Uncharacterized protein n=1 Tax=Cryptosporangium arvum DSM 44712 TaxID=927661 RepID=A0A010ZKP4_9ACTN|nr:hypothetical protein [Cryptosporangium arvum]EXG79219.1 hypothetical protein CryarDRAFT_0248 [Cryptosporangium arvum DSM 44712]
MISPVTMLRPRPDRVTEYIEPHTVRAPVSRAGGTLRALTAALAPHLSTTDPELHGLAACLLTAQEAYASDASTDREELRRQYHGAAQDYCVAMDRRGFATPPGLRQAVRWLADPATGADEPVRVPPADPTE